MLHQVAKRELKTNKSHQSLPHISPHACTTMEDVDLDWDDFAKFYKLLYSTIAILEHVIAKFKEFTTFFRFLGCLQGRKKHTFNGARPYPPSC
jgi:hypothetical protein